ncbi:thiamine phosphate synthase [Pedobacter endophyticus]|uniref:Thiamine phosphate synthase n=1 Tax=Pedobacter endophyticus TaxID=2789740 RepID=A0A7U3Q347_9SPHI|nr:thiamine phosphate synthase [Pedobacter endophyticus]QPH37650.1 thiamine phosphate synthase [Pedobacter endophyticus]
MKYIEKLQYITNDHPSLSHVEQVQLACEAGAKWVQYRCMSKSDEALLTDINAIAEICDDWGTTLIVAEHVQFVGKADIQGFHIEQDNADFTALRKLVGNDITLGGFANSFSDIIRAASDGADYVTFGPFSATIANDVKPLALDAYQNAVTKLRELNVQLPVLAVGAITLADVAPLMETGIYGVAVSEAINLSDDFIEAYQDFYDAVKG